MRAPFAIGLLGAIATIALSGCQHIGAGESLAVAVTVDVGGERRPINPLIYGVNWATTRQLALLNSPLNRQGGNSTSRYNWRINASNRGRDWYFQSTPLPDPTPGERGDSFIADTRSAGAEPMLTIPMLEWIAALGPGRSKRAGFSISKYGPQTASDERWFPDAGNGIGADGSFIAGNDPSDAGVPSNAALQEEWVAHLIARWGGAARGGLRYYVLDNEPSIWHSTHRDVRPVGATMAEVRSRIIEFATMIKSRDPRAQVVAPEEWGWTAYFRSGFDQQWGARHGWSKPLPDRAHNGNWPYLPWLLDQLRREHERTGRRLLDVFSVHFYPKGGESSADDSIAMQRRRNRSTRALWDRSYRDDSWIDDHVYLIPRLREWVEAHYPGTAIAITEYDWGAEHHISGALAQVDILGIFGREGLDMAARWEAPAEGTPVFEAFRLYRDYDGNKATFGDTAVPVCVDADADELAAFAAERSVDRTLTVILLNKSQADSRRVVITLKGFDAAAGAELWRFSGLLTRITRLANAQMNDDVVEVVLPAQSATLLVVKRHQATVIRREHERPAQ